VALFRGVLLRTVVTNRWLTTIGGTCYSIYLLHMIIITIFGRFTTRFTLSRSYDVNFIIQAVLLAVPVLVIGGIYFVLIERPCMRRDWPQALWVWAQAKTRQDATYTAAARRAPPRNSKNSTT
jgi:peptidoglycan/LPS O-acetylase OafA/YrhL